MKTVTIGISSGIAAFKILDLIKLLKKNDICVEVIMTGHATKMLTSSLVEKELDKPVYLHLYPVNFNAEEILKDRVVDHIALADKTDVFVIAPATANTIAKLAHGIADDFLTTTALAVTAPVIVCPSMNVNMWNNPIVQANITILRNAGMIILDPEDGPLACGYEGKGRLADIRHIFEEITTQLKMTTALKGKTVIVTAGATIDPIDAVRVVSNRSSGKMGVAIAEACYLKGANVILLRSSSAVHPRYQIVQKTFETPAELESLVQGYAKNADILFHAAAVGDFAIKTHPGKLSSKKPHILHLTPRSKILDTIKHLNHSLYVVGFKAEFESRHKNLALIAKTKLETSGVDMIVANDISRQDRGFAVDSNEVIVVSGNSEEIIPLSSKKTLALEIVNRVIQKASVA